MARWRVSFTGSDGVAHTVAVEHRIRLGQVTKWAECTRDEPAGVIKGQRVKQLLEKAMTPSRHLSSRRQLLSSKSEMSEGPREREFQNRMD